MKPIWAITGVGLIGATGVATALFLASPGADEELVQQAATDSASSQAALTSGPRVTLWRWMEVTVLIPDDSGIRANPDTIYFDDHGSISRPGLSLHKVDPVDSDFGSYAAIDAETGEILRREVRPEDHDEFERILATVRVSAFDPATAPWPYNGDPPPRATNEAPSIRPHPATGMYVDYVSGSAGRSGTATPADCELALSGIAVRNGRSSAGIAVDARTGSVCKNVSLVQPVDLAAFQRFLDYVELCEFKDAQC